MKLGILDVKVFLQDGTRINLEMQLRRQKFWEKRSLYYLAKMYADILFMGEHFDRLRRCIAISILNFNLTEDDRYHSVYRMRDETGKDYSDLLELHIIELRKTLTGNGRIDDWIRLFNAETEEDLRMVVEKNKYMSEAAEEMYERNADEAIREKCRAREEYYRHQRWIQKQLEDQKRALAEKDQALEEKDQIIAEREQTIDAMARERAADKRLIAELQAKLSNR